MKRLSTIIFCLVAVPCLWLRSASAEDVVTYLDENYKQATPSNYTYKRFVRKIALAAFTGHYTYNHMYSCSVNDFYKTGEPAFSVTVHGSTPQCPEMSYDGKAVYFYKNGKPKRIEHYKAGKLQGTVTAYNEDGTVTKQEVYEKGKRIENNKFAVSASSPLIGTWKYVEYFDPNPNRRPTSPFDKMISDLNVKRTIMVTYFPNRVLEVTSQDSYSRTTEKRNWNYITESRSSGILEESQGDDLGDLIERGNVTWITRNQFEYTTTFSRNANAVGNRYVFIRQ